MISSVKINVCKDSSVSTSIKESFQIDDMSRSTNVSSEASSSLTESGHPIIRGCMVVRTLDESLHKDKKSDNLHERARFRRRLRVGNFSGQSLNDSLRSTVSLNNLSDETFASNKTVSCHGRLESLPLDDGDSLQVGFSLVQIREYPITLGDNPGVSAGPALTIDWEHQDEVELTLEEYESERPPRRNYVEMSIPRNIRVKMLEGYGHSRHEIQVAVKKTNIGRRNRKKTNAMLHLSDHHEAFEIATRALRNCLNLKKRKKKERRMLHLSEEFQKKRSEEAIRVENEAAAEELRLLEEYNLLKQKMETDAQYTEVRPPSNPVSSHPYGPTTSQDSKQPEEAEFVVSLKGHSFCNTADPKPIISCKET